MIASLPGPGPRRPHPGRCRSRAASPASASGLPPRGGWRSAGARKSFGYSSLAADRRGGIRRGSGAVEALAVVLEGGHGEVFMQASLRIATWPRTAALRSLPPRKRSSAGGRTAIGNGVRHLAALDPDRDAARGAAPRRRRAAAAPRTSPPAAAPDLWPRARRQDAGRAGPGMSGTLNLSELREGGSRTCPRSRRSCRRRSIRASARLDQRPMHGNAVAARRLAGRSPASTAWMPASRLRVRPATKPNCCCSPPAPPRASPWNSRCLACAISNRRSA
jgi:hypothetical protein